jgi:hypothetical protein
MKIIPWMVVYFFLLPLQSHAKSCHDLISDLNFKYKLEFEIGEKVRFRDAQGKMKMGIVEDFESDWVKVKESSSEAITVKNTSVFKLSKDFKAYTPKLRSPASSESHSLNLESSGALDFFNRAAVITSHPIFLNASLTNQLRTLMDYFMLFTHPKWIFQKRHGVVLLGIMLAETGYRVKINSGSANSEGAKTSWLTASPVSFKDATPDDIFILDPLNALPHQKLQVKGIVTSIDVLSSQFYGPSDYTKNSAKSSDESL